MGHERIPVGSEVRFTESADKNQIYWTMRDGNKIDVDDMDENHLRNTLKMLIRNSRVKKKKKGNIEQQFQNAREDGMTECYFDIH